MQEEKMAMCLYKEHTALAPRCMFCKQSSHNVDNENSQ